MLRVLRMLFVPGTIDKDYPRATGGYAFEISDPAVSRVLQRAHINSAFVEMVTVCQKDSQYISQQDRWVNFEKQILHI